MTGVIRLVFGVAVVAGVWLVWIRPPQGPPTAARATASPSVAVIRPTPVVARGTALTLTFTEKDLTFAAAAYFPQTVSGATLTDPQVKLGSGQIVLICAASMSVFKTTAVVTATPIVSAGRVTGRIDSATVAGVAVPDSVRAGLAAQLDQAIAGGVPPGFTVSTVTVANGTLTIQGTTSP